MKEETNLDFLKTKILFCCCWIDILTVLSIERVLASVACSPQLFPTFILSHSCLASRKIDKIFYFCFIKKTYSYELNYFWSWNRIFFTWKDLIKRKFWSKSPTSAPDHYLENLNKADSSNMSSFFHLPFKAVMRVW